MVKMLTSIAIMITALPTIVPCAKTLIAKMSRTLTWPIRLSTLMPVLLPVAQISAPLVLMLITNVLSKALLPFRTVISTASLSPLKTMALFSRTRITA